MIDSETKLKIVELRSKDWSIARIAKSLKLGKQTVVDTVKEMRDEIATLQAVQLDALYEAESLSVRSSRKAPGGAGESLAGGRTYGEAPGLVP